MKETLRFEVNGRPVSLEVDPGRSLLWVLRDELGLMGTKYGCGEGICGACTVLIDGEAVRSCQYPMKDVRAKKVTTIEGLAAEGRLHPLQEAFVRHNVMQCGFCTPGMILTAASFLRKTRSRPGKKLSGRWRTTSAAAAPICGSSGRSKRPPRR